MAEINKQTVEHIEEILSKAALIMDPKIKNYDAYIFKNLRDIVLVTILPKLVTQAFIKLIDLAETLNEQNRVLQEQMNLNENYLDVLQKRCTTLEIEADKVQIKQADKVQFNYFTYGYPVKNGVRDGLRISLDYHIFYTVKVVYTDRLVVTSEDTDLELETFQDFIRTMYRTIEV